MALRVWDRGGTRRVATVNEFSFPSGVRQRFGFAFPSMTSDGVATVEAATRQWFRLTARQPRARLTMPSVAVDAMWHELTLHTGEYEQLCRQAFGRPLHHIPASSVDPAAAGPGLRTAYQLACTDESTVKPALPLLFRVDAELAVAGGHRYLADCGGRAQCYDVQPIRCLQHIAGVGKRRSQWSRDPENRGDYYGGTYGGGGGCGGGT